MIVLLKLNMLIQDKNTLEQLIKKEIYTYGEQVKKDNLVLNPKIIKLIILFNQSLNMI